MVSGPAGGAAGRGTQRIRAFVDPRSDGPETGPGCGARNATYLHVPRPAPGGQARSGVGRRRRSSPARLHRRPAEACDFAARALARAAPHMPGVTVLGPAPAPLAVLRGRHRRRLLMQAERTVNLQAVLREWLARVRIAGSTRLQVDIDPYSFL